jgi:hypothetical protein
MERRGACHALYLAVVPSPLREAAAVRTKTTPVYCARAHTCIKGEESTTSLRGAFTSEEAARCEVERPRGGIRALAFP